MKTLEELMALIEPAAMGRKGAWDSLESALRELIADAEQLRAILDAAGIEVQYHEQGVTWFRP